MTSFSMAATNSYTTQPVTMSNLSTQLNLTNSTSFDYEQQEPATIIIVVNYLHFYGTPLLVCVGLVTNFISLLVFTTPKLRSHSSSVYLASMAISDSGFLISLFIGWLGWVDIHLFHRFGWCQLVVYLTYVCSFLSAWNVASFTVERYIAVVYPFQRIRMCTVSRAIIVVVGEAVFALLLYSTSLWSSQVLYDQGVGLCSTRSVALRLVEVLMNVDTIITLILPSLVIITLNIRIAITLYYFSKKRELLSESIKLERQRSTSSSRAHRTLSHKSSDASGTCSTKSTTPEPRHTTVTHTQKNGNRTAMASIPTQGSSPNHNKVHIRVTSMLLVVSTVFVSLNLPSHAFRLYIFIIGSANISTTLAYWLELMVFLSYLNFAINFFLYVGLRKAFRMEIANLFIRLRHKILLLYYRSLCFDKCCAPSERDGGLCGRCSRSSTYNSNTRSTFI